MSNPVALLRKVLLLDATTCLATGLLLVLFAGSLAEPLGLATGFLRLSGASLLPFAAFLLHTARRPALSRTQLWVVIALNALWVVDSVLVLTTGFVQPTMLGTVFVAAQAAAVAVLADLELLGTLKLRACVSAT